MTSEDAAFQLREGNARFASFSAKPWSYSKAHMQRLAEGQSPIAAIVACADSRVAPEIVFDQPLGSIFVSRVPANVASDSAKWMIDIAVGEFRVPLVVVMAHSGCLAVRQVVEGKDGPGGLLRYRVHSAFRDVCLHPGPNVYERTIIENAHKTCRDLCQESPALNEAIRTGQTKIVAARFDIETGHIVWLD